MLPSWVRLQAPSVLDSTLNVDEGEMEAICLAREIRAAAILMDDRAGHGEQDIGRDGRGARRHQLILLHVLLLPT